MKRLFKTGVAILLLIVCLIGIAKGADETEPERIAYTVGYGDTIWSIAAENCPDMRTDKAMYLIRKWNGCGDCIIHAGDVLMIPKGGDER